MGQEIGRFDSVNRVLDEMTEFPALFLGYPGLQVLDFDKPLAHEDNLRDVFNAGNPGIADELGIECEKSFRLLWVTARRGLPFQQTVLAIQYPYRINVGNELVFSDWPPEFDLQIAARLLNLNTIVLTETNEEHEALLEHPIPRVLVRELQGLVLDRRPCAEEDFS